MMSAHNLLARQLPDGRESKVDPSAPAKQAIDHSDFCAVPGSKLEAARSDRKSCEMLQKSNFIQKRSRQEATAYTINSISIQGEGYVLIIY